MGVGRTAFSVAFALFACSGRLPHPPYVSHPTAALVEVGFPPPPARPEAIPSKPVDDAVWLDGEWTWRSRRWAWLPGRWVVAPPGSTYSPWVCVRASDGTVFCAPGTWRDASGQPIEQPKPLALANVTGGVVFDANGEVESTGGVVDPTRVRRRAVDGGT